MMYQLSKADWDCLKRLRNNGCAVCVFTTEEVGNADAGDVEEVMCAAGWEPINVANPERLTV